VIPMLDKVGIKAKVKQVETAVLAEVVRTGDFQAYVYSQSTGPDPLAALKCYYSKTPQSACNYMSFKNADFDKLIDDAGQTDDSAKRIQLLQKANALLYEEAPVWFFNYNKAVMAVQPWLKGVQLNPTELTHQNVEDLWVTEASPAK
jgi:peptide/nickel transport system substrate-binding protein